MRKVELRMNEQHKYEVIKRLVENNGNKKRAAIELGCTIRIIDRLIIKYKNFGKVGFMHWNRNKKPSIEEINYTLAIISPRVFDNGSSIRYQNKYWQAYKDDKIVSFQKKTKALVIKAFNGQILVTVDENIYELVEVPKHDIYSKRFMEPPTKLERKKAHIPPMSHPWKHDSYISYLNSLPHHENYANVYFFLRRFQKILTLK